MLLPSGYTDKIIRVLPLSTGDSDRKSIGFPSI
jgi:hypothetical protein